MDNMQNHELNIDELTEVSGGYNGSSKADNASSKNTVKAMCPSCGKVQEFIPASGGRATCKNCGGVFTI